jgi:hypothetical protein
MRKDAKTFFELAEKERVAVKRGHKYVNLIIADSPDTRYVSEDWIKEFLAIPGEFRVNPFEISPSGDLFYADKRNLERVDEAIAQARDGQVSKLSKEELSVLLGL